MAKAAFPGFIPPMLAALQAAPPRGPSWVHELKLDGYRLQAHIQAEQVRLLTRKGLDWSARFGRALPRDLRALGVKSAILDGELVHVAENGLPSFPGLQEALAGGSKARLLYYVFDLLYLDGHDLRQLPLLERKAALAAVVTAPGLVRYTEHFDDGAALFRHVCDACAEGVVSKRRASAYRSGRGKSWVKAVCVLRTEFVIAGFLLLRGTVNAVGALVLGYFAEGQLIYAGRVGTGFTEAIAVELYHRLEALEVPASPFATRLPRAEARGVRFVRPELVAEVALRGWTREGLVRAASFQGLREDRRAEDVAIARSLSP